MITNTTAKRLLFFGDSLTWGRIANKSERFDEKTRFTGVLQEQLGSDFEIIEEGLRGRMVYGENYYFPYRDGYNQFPAILLSHLPLNLLVIFLGTNDFNSKSGKDSMQIAKELEKYINFTHELATSLNFSSPRILLIAPPLINEEYLKGETMFAGATEKMKDYSAELSNISNANSTHFFDSNNYIQVCKEDGVHLDVKANNILGIELSKFIMNLRL